MSYTCTDCGKTIRTVRDVRYCVRCRDNGNAARVADNNDSDLLTLGIIGFMMAASSDSPAHESAPSFSGGGGESGGAGASGGWDSDSSSSDFSSDSSSDSSSSSSDSGSDSGGSSSE